jgi:hypothetical protein
MIFLSESYIQVHPLRPMPVSISVGIGAPARVCIDQAQVRLGTRLCVYIEYILCLLALAQACVCV